MFDLRCRCTKVSAQGSNNGRFNYVKSVHNGQKHKPKAFTRVVDLNRDESEFARILEQGAIEGLE